MQVGDIVKRLEEAIGPDRELDRAIGFLLDGWELSGDADNLIYVPNEVTYYADHPGAMYPSFTENIDAALGLVERLIPSARLQLTRDPDMVGWWARLDDAPHSEQAETPALAILLAALRAKEPQP